MKTKEQLITEANAAIAELRSRGAGPFNLTISENVDIELRISSEGDRVIVGREGWADVTVNFHKEGLALNVSAHDEPGSLISTLNVSGDQMVKAEWVAMGKAPPAEQDVFTGFLKLGAERIQIDFSADKGASDTELDAAALDAIAQQAELNYLQIS